MTMTLEQVRDWLEPRYKNQPDDVYDAVEAAIRERADLWSKWQAERCFREKAEAELAALKARIADSAHVDVTLGCAVDGEIPPDLALCKVALVKVEK